MSLSDLASLGSFVSGAAVLASLVFLFFQMRRMTEQVRQSERNQQALISQGGRTRTVGLLMASAEPALADAIAKGFAGDEDISTTQWQQFTAYVGASLMNLADGFFQHKEGLIPDSGFAEVQGGLRGLVRNPGARQYWADSREIFNFPDDFVKFVDGVIAETPLRAQTNRFNQWKSGVAALKTNTSKQ
jgi:hypothetical protein